MSEKRPVLVAEDNHDDVRLLEFAWGNAKCPVPLHVVHDGDEALSYLNGTGQFADRQRFPLPMLFLLDLKMPRKDGFEVLEWRRHNPQVARLPVIVFTASLHKEDVDRAYDLGANAFLVKPVELQHLVSMVKAIQDFWLGHNRTAAL